jgi:uncharacterized protein YqgC (DUF456 family)
MVATLHESVGTAEPDVHAHSAFRVIDLDRAAEPAGAHPGTQHRLVGVAILLLTSAAVLPYKDLALPAVLLSAVAVALARATRSHEPSGKYRALSSAMLLVATLVFVASIVALAVAGHFFTELHREFGGTQVGMLAQLVR